jgi:hypothetical protein
MNEKETIFDVAVIGAGPAGMMAAGRAGELGASVVLLEKNKKIGEKLLLTGNGRCNITNAEFDVKKLVSSYGKNGRFLFPAFFEFGVKKVIDFFNNNNVPTKIERGNRVFPKSNKARDVLRSLWRYMSKNKVIVVCDAEVHRLSYKDKKIKKIILKNKRTITAKKYIICTGGLSYPKTGSTGSGLRWAPSLEHTIKEPSPALVPIKIKEEWAREMKGLSLKNVEVTVVGKNKKIKKFGECLFTHFGLSGPIILELSKEIGLLLKDGEVKLSLDLKPALDIKKLDERIKRDFQKYSNKLFKNGLDDLLPNKMISTVIGLSQIVPEKEINKISKEERKRLVKLLKNIEMTVTGLMGFDLAIVTSGGISLNEINEKTMQSKIVDNLFFAGEVIDIDGPTGGFNLQMCWSTGYLAGENAVKSLK